MAATEVDRLTRTADNAYTIGQLYFSSLDFLVLTQIISVFAIRAAQPRIAI
jgi:hypothetical protein